MADSHAQMKAGRPAVEPGSSIEARLMLAAIVESSDDAIISKDLTGRITSWNAAAQRMFGYTGEEIIGQSVLRIIPPELQWEEPGILNKLQAGERIDHYETVRRHKDGHLLDVSLTISPIRNERGKVVGASKIARDISDRRRAQEILVETEKLAATARMAATMAHEINNPLEAVINLAYLLITNTSLDAEARKYAQLLLNEISRVSDITRQTLAFYRDTSRPADVNLAILMGDLLELQRHRFVGQNVVLKQEFEDGAVVWGFRQELHQVFSNLVINALDAVGPGGEIRVRVQVCGGDGNRICVTVADNGSGIPPRVKARIFDPFFTTKATKGNGLGLWVSQAIVKKHEGSIQVRSSTNPARHGTAFRVTLPRRAQKLAFPQSA
jgi:PAS domain S-box-containing protein